MRRCATGFCDLARRRRRFNALLLWSAPPKPNIQRGSPSRSFGSSSSSSSTASSSSSSSSLPRRPTIHNARMSAKKKDDDHNTAAAATVITEGSCRMEVASATADNDNGDGDGDAVFYNPVQVQNRDLSVLVIALHAERRRARELEKHRKRRRHKKQQQANEEEGAATASNKKTDSTRAAATTAGGQTQEKTSTANDGDDEPPPPSAAAAAAATTTPPETTTTVAQPQQQEAVAAATAAADAAVVPGLCILDALAASGLRSLRYWNECRPHVHHVTINDLDPAAADRAVRTVHLNGLSEHLLPTTAAETTTEGGDAPRPFGIRIQTSDATDVLYASRRPNRNRPRGTPIVPPSDGEQWDVIDLDPYGSAAPFLDGAVQAVAHGGLLNVTCTDMAALGGSHPETCFGRYAAMPVQRAGYLQELALRVLLHSVAVAAARYGRTVHPLVSVGMDFYVRVFVEVRDDKAGVQALSLRVGQVYQSTQCPTFECVAAGQLGGRKGRVYQPSRLRHGCCPETGAPWKVAGPLWLGPLHDPDVLREALRRLEPPPPPSGDDSKDGDPQPPLLPELSLLATRERLRGLLQSCRDELPDCPLYYRLPDLARALRVATPPVADVRSALVNAGYRASGYHKDPQALKTDAPSGIVWDVLRAWARLHPPREPPAEGSVAARILAAEPGIEVDFAPAASVLEARRRDVKRFPGNPQPNWGPKPRASGKKRKAAADHGAAAEAVEEE